MQLVRSLDTEAWRRVIQEHPGGNVFHTPEMFQVFARAQGHRPTLWAVADDQSQVLALLLPVRVTLMQGLLKTLTTRSVVYGGLFCPAGAGQQQALALLLEAYVHKRRPSLFTELRHLHDSSSYQPVLQAHGFEFEEHQDFLVNLDLPVEQVWTNIHKSARKKIRQAENRNALTIEELQDRTQLPRWYALLQKTYTTARIPLAHYSLFEAAFDILYPKGMAQFLLGRVQDRCIAASVALLYKDKIYGWYRGFDREYGHYLPNDLMVWHLLKWGVEHGYRAFDFGGAGKPGEEYGPRRFKAKFGGELVSYGRNTCTHWPLLLKLSRLNYQIYRRFFLGGAK